MEVDAVADREALRHVGDHVVVDEDAVGERDPGSVGELDIGQDADADHRDLGRDARTRRRLDRDDAAALPDDPPDRRIEADVAAPAAVELEEMPGNLRRDDPAHQPVDGFEHGHRLAEEACRPGNLEPDEAAADHDNIVGRVQPRPQPPRIVGVAEGENPVEVTPLDPRPAWPRTGREHQPREADRAAVGKAHLPLAPIDRRPLRRRA